MKKCLLLVAIAAAAFASSPSFAGTVTFDPGAAGLPGAAFSFDALQGVEVSRIDNTFDMMGGLTFVENGFLRVTGATLGGVDVATGLGVDYTLYFAFSITGSSPSIVVPGTIDGGSMTLYGVAGVSAFGFTGGNVAFVDNGGNTPVALFSSTITGGVIGANIVSPNPLALDLFASLVATVDPLAAGFLASPSDPLALSIAAEHASSTVQVLDGGAVFLVDGGPDVITFSAVPEPASLAMVGMGALALGTLACRRRSAP